MVVEVRVGSEVRGYVTYVPFPVASEPTETLDLSMVDGNTTPLGKTTLIVPVPAAKADETPKVTSHDD